MGYFDVTAKVISGRVIHQLMLNGKRESMITC